MSDNFHKGQRVEFSTNFYSEPQHQHGTGTVDRIEKCESEGGCACGAGETVFVTVDSSKQTLAYVGKELTAA